MQNIGLNLTGAANYGTDWETFQSKEQRTSAISHRYYKDNSKYAKHTLDTQHEYGKIEDSWTFLILVRKEDTWILGKNFTYKNSMSKNYP
jgi:hypothetical protein